MWKVTHRDYVDEDNSSFGRFVVPCLLVETDMKESYAEGSHELVQDSLFYWTVTENGLHPKKIEKFLDGTKQEWQLCS